MRDLAHRRTNDHHVEVGKFNAFSRTRVLVAYIAPADDRHLVVSGKRLVVHAVIHTREISKKVGCASTALHQRVVEAHLDIRMRIEGGDRFVETGRIRIVQQDAHAHAAIGCTPNRFE